MQHCSKTIQAVSMQIKKGIQKLCQNRANGNNVSYLARQQTEFYLIKNCNYGCNTNWKFKFHIGQVNSLKKNNL